MADVLFAFIFLSFKKTQQFETYWPCYFECNWRKNSPVRPNGSMLFEMQSNLF